MRPALVAPVGDGHDVGRHSRDLAQRRDDHRRVADDEHVQRVGVQVRLRRGEHVCRRHGAHALAVAIVVVLRQAWITRLASAPAIAPVVS